MPATGHLTRCSPIRTVTQLLCHSTGHSTSNWSQKLGSFFPKEPRNEPIAQISLGMIPLTIDPLTASWNELNEAVSGVMSNDVPTEWPPKGPMVVGTYLSLSNRHKHAKLC